MGSFKMKNVHRFDFSNLNKDLIDHDYEDDEISDDDVFIHDRCGNHYSEENGVKKPLMAPRTKNIHGNSTKLHTRIRKVPAIRVIFAPLGYCCTVLIAIAGLVCLTLYFVHKFGTQSGVLQTRQVPYSACSNVKVNDVWTQTFPMLGTESAIRLVDINQDGFKDIIIGFSTGVASYHYPKFVCDIYFDGIKGCGGGVMALDGRNGKQLWRHYTNYEIFALNCNVDIDSDGINDCLASGRIATLVAIGGRNGTRIWTFDDKDVIVERSNIYTAQYINDVDHDGVGDVLVIHGGDPFKKPGELRNLAARIVVLSSRSGKVLKWVKVPDGFESYYSPQILVHPDGSEGVLFGTGGETHGGSLWYISIHDLLYGSMSKSKEIYRDDYKGVMTPPALVDITADGIPDIVMSTFNSTVVAFDGLTFRQLWNTTFDGSESYSTPGVGFYNHDDTTDFIVNYQTGPGFPIYYYTQTTILDGVTGQSLFTEPVKSAVGTQASPLVYSMQGRGNDVFLYWESSCHGYENISTEYEFLKGTNIHTQTRVNYCLQRFGTSEYYTRMYLTSRKIGQPGIIVYDSDSRKDIEYDGNLDYSEIGLEYLRSHPGAREEYERQLLKTNDYDDRSENNYEAYENSIADESQPNSHFSSHTDAEMQMNMGYPRTHNVRKHGRYGQDRMWKLYPESTKHRDDNFQKTYADDMSGSDSSFPQQGKMWFPSSNDYDGDEYMNSRIWDNSSPTLQRYPSSHYGNIPKPNRWNELSHRRRRPPYYNNKNVWNGSRGKKSNYGKARPKRHVGFHDGEGIQRIISTGTLAPSLNDNDNNSIDVIFATYWFHPQKAITILPDDKKCIENKMRDESERFQLYKGMDHDAYEKKVTIECLKKNGHYVEGSNVFDEPPYDPFNISMGMMTIYRLHISCTCDSNVTLCAQGLPWQHQGWPSYMGLYSNGYVIPRTNV